mmetsp:Transcript_100390/g.289943  ORF Transcript_100390/g.289943 Transcript_100390/m.289943 type:complete len:343 (+) Transcript_100390:130-1158(+)
MSLYWPALLPASGGHLRMARPSRGANVCVPPDGSRAPGLCVCLLDAQLLDPAQVIGEVLQRAHNDRKPHPEVTREFSIFLLEAMALGAKLFVQLLRAVQAVRGANILGLVQPRVLHEVGGVRDHVGQHLGDQRDRREHIELHPLDRLAPQHHIEDAAGSRHGVSCLAEDRAVGDPILCRCKHHGRFRHQQVEVAQDPVAEFHLERRAATLHDLQLRIALGSDAARTREMLRGFLQRRLHLVDIRLEEALEALLDGLRHTTQRFLKVVRRLLALKDPLDGSLHDDRDDDTTQLLVLACEDLIRESCRAAGNHQLVYTEARNQAPDIAPSFGVEVDEHEGGHEH